MKALIDEQLSPKIAVLLRDAGYDVLAVADRDDLVDHSDRIVFEVAGREGRALVTNTVKDFRPLAAEWLAAGRTHPGLIRIVVPKPLRDALGLTPGTVVDISQYGNGVQITPGGRTARLERDATGRLVARSDSVVTDEVMFGLIDAGRR